MEVCSLNCDEPICAFTFWAEDFADLEKSPPIILSLPNDLFTPNDTITPGTEDALSKILQHTPKVYCIVVTNFVEIAVFTPPRKERPGYTFERFKTTQFTLALRAISGATFHDSLPRTQFIQYPAIDTIAIIHEGPSQNPNKSLPSDQEYVKEHKTPITRPGEILTVVTIDTGTLFPENARPLFPFDLSELPMDTRIQLKDSQRESPLVVDNMGQRLAKSRNFAIEILNIISENSADGMSSVYLCQITSIDGQPVSSSGPTLCLKPFDDRFQQMDIPEGELDYTDYFAKLDDAPSVALNEAQIYDKLRPVQGTIIPWFYGIHQFTLPNGLILPGLIMEYIQGSRLDSKYVRIAGPETQIQISCRHGCRVLDRADIAQRDWHRGQIIIHTNPETQLDHPVFIDFAFAIQTWELVHMFIIQNYFDLFYVLKRPDGLDGRLVDEYFGPPDDWDPRAVHTSDDTMIAATDMFPYISSC